ncbi:transglutaminase superfamily protein [Cytobacillus oceanisediminis]|uniref:Transglutaminase superfamily protein n=1 Tax=Cytobacillus oceanisediminis TaxID=665099 RepID=A0A2V2ZHJ0_9BACI|nr:transglutaminase-like domain-containing protein [Cytobacillus oceanisediminis]PWW17610.1 transglutaminase superfamily protein [Cytobacillus oceanisediminis]
MTQKNHLLIIFICLVSSCLFLSACSNSDTSNTETKATKKEEDKFEKLAEEKNKELELAPLELTSYSQEVQATLKNPEYKEFAVNGKVTVEGEVEKYSELKSEYAWIKVRSTEEGPAGYDHEYFAPIKEGKFKQPIRFFNGEGEYRVTVQLPSMDSDNYYYDTAAFTVHNVSSEVERDITFTPFGQEAEINLDLNSSYVKENEVFTLKGEAGNLADSDTIMLKLNKDAETWKHVIPIKDGKFSYKVPLFYGNGIHNLEILIPDKERENYYQTATILLIDNESDRIMSPIEYSKTYEERGVTLEYPQYGGEESDGTFTVKGKIDPKAEFGSETTHIYITTKKGEDEALDVIPVEDFIFDDSFYLRFGPGTYEVTLSVPEIKEENSDYFRFYGFAKFEVESTGEDKRDLLPSRGIQSHAQPITELATEITEGKSSDREKAKAVYDYVAKTISYDVEKLETDDFNWDDSALKTLDSKTGVCQDYSYLTIALLRASNMEARFVEGTAFSGFWPQRHAWVEVKVDGSWLTMDPTWGAGYIKDDKFVAAFNDKYFDPNKAEFEKTHNRTGVSY